MVYETFNSPERTPTIAEMIIDYLDRQGPKRFSDIVKYLHKHDNTINRELKKLVGKEIVIKKDKKYTLNHDHPTTEKVLTFLHILPPNNKIYNVLKVIEDEHTGRGFRIAVSTVKSSHVKHALEKVIIDGDVGNKLTDAYYEIRDAVYRERATQILKIDDDKERARLANELTAEEENGQYNIGVHIF